MSRKKPCAKSNFDLTLKNLQKYQTLRMNLERQPVSMSYPTTWQWHLTMHNASD